jgi:hypothetical protein
MKNCKKCGCEFAGFKCQPCANKREVIRRGILRADKPPRILSKDQEVTQEILRERFHYDPLTGLFTRIKGFSHNAVEGALVTTTDRYGYLFIRIFEKQFRLHRLVWLYVHGRWPAEAIDHINGNRADNRLANLRECTIAQNNYNRRRRKGPSGLRGVHRNAKSGKWQARISTNGKEQILGHFDDPKLAHAAYCEAAKKLHGEFAKFD